MKNHLLRAAVIIVGLVLGWNGFKWWYSRQFALEYIQEDFLQNRKNEMTPIIPQQQTEEMKIIEAINTRNASINSVSCNVDIRATHQFTVKLTAVIRHEKKLRFRMQTNSVLGRESDIGSNDTHFWFWSKRMDPPYLFFGRHENLMKSRLRTPFNPEWLVELLGVGDINYQNAFVVRNGKLVAILQPKTSTNGEQITKVTLIDPERMVVVGHYLYDSADKLIASAEVESLLTTNTGHIVPRKLKMIWHEEGVLVEWTLRDIRINAPQSPSSWQMPDVRQKMELGN